MIGAYAILAAISSLVLINLLDNISMSGAHSAQTPHLRACDKRELIQREGYL